MISESQIRQSISDRRKFFYKPLVDKAFSVRPALCHKAIIAINFPLPAFGNNHAQKASQTGRYFIPFAEGICKKIRGATAIVKESAFFQGGNFGTGQHIVSLNRGVFGFGHFGSLQWLAGFVSLLRKQIRRK
jgi:hypothetical protein